MLGIIEFGRLRANMVRRLRKATFADAPAWAMRDAFGGHLEKKS